MNLVDELHAIARTLREAGVGTLLKMKRLAGRPQDLADLAALEGLDDAF